MQGDLGHPGEDSVNKSLGACLDPEPRALEPPGRTWTKKSHGVIGQPCCHHQGRLSRFGGLCLAQPHPT